jgi:hypothetical protein
VEFISKTHMRFFLKCIDCWQIIESGWSKLNDATLELIPTRNARLANDKALHDHFQALSPSEFAKISNCEVTQEAWKILETTYEGTKLVKFAKLQILISRFEEIKMLEDETFREFYTKMRDLRNSMVSLGKTFLDVKFIQKIIRSLPEGFRIKVTTIEESKDLKEMKIEELVGSLQTYELSLPPVKKVKTIALKASKKKARVSSEEDSDNEEDDVAMLAKIFGRLIRNDKFKMKFSKRLKKAPKESEPEEAKKKDPRGPNVLNAQALGIYGLAMGISSREKGRPIM